MMASDEPATALRAYQDYQALAQQAKMRQARLAMSARMQQIGMSALEAKPLEKIGAYAAVQIIHEANDMQRKDTGEPDQRLEVSGPGGGALVVRWLTPDEAEAQRRQAEQQKTMEREAMSHEATASE
jgi:hypothetical protein